MKLDNCADPIAIVGLGETGIASADFLIGRGREVVIYHRDVSVPDNERVNDLISGGTRVVSGFTDPLKSLCDRHDFILMSPGVLTSESQRAEIRTTGTRLENDVTLFLSERKGPSAGITGSNGKSTTTTLAAKILQASGMEARACGNIGFSPLRIAHSDQPGAIPVIEISNAQLELFQKEDRIGVGLLNNLSPNHLNRYQLGGESKEAAFRIYVETKFRLLENAEIPIFNADDPITNQWIAGYDGLRERCLCFSLEGPVEEGAYLDEASHNLLVRRHGESHVICGTGDLRLMGRHNVANALAASLVAFELGGSIDGMRKALRSFGGLNHRIETVAQIEGIRFVNDSKSTSPASTIEALRSFSEPTVLILGGDAKGAEFDSEVLRQSCGQVEAVVKLPGCDSERLSSPFIEMGIPVIEANLMEDAVEQAFATIKRGVVLLSPAASSLPERTFEERGEDFAKATDNLERSILGGN